MQGLSPNGSKIDIDFIFEELRIAIAFPCRIAVRAASNYMTTTTQEFEFDHKSHCLLFSAPLRLTAVIHPYKENIVEISIFLFTRNGNKCAGKIKFDVQKAIMNCLFSQKLFVENCPDKTATLSFRFSVSNIREARTENAKANAAPLSKNSSFSAINSSAKSREDQGPPLKSLPRRESSQQAKLSNNSSPTGIHLSFKPAKTTAKDQGDGFQFRKSELAEPRSSEPTNPTKSAEGQNKIQRFSVPLESEGKAQRNSVASESENLVQKNSFSMKSQPVRKIEGQLAEGLAKSDDFDSKTNSDPQKTAEFFPEPSQPMEVRPRAEVQDASPKVISAFSLQPQEALADQDRRPPLRPSLQGSNEQIAKTQHQKPAEVAEKSQLIFSLNQELQQKQITIDQLTSDLTHSQLVQRQSIRTHKEALDELLQQNEQLKRKLETSQMPSDQSKWQSLEVELLEKSDALKRLENDFSKSESQRKELRKRFAAAEEAWSTERKALEQRIKELETKIQQSPPSDLADLQVKNEQLKNLQQLVEIERHRANFLNEKFEARNLAYVSLEKSLLAERKRIAQLEAEAGRLRQQGEHAAKELEELTERRERHLAEVQEEKERFMHEIYGLKMLIKEILDEKQKLFGADELTSSGFEAQLRSLRESVNFSDLHEAEIKRLNQAVLELKQMLRDKEEEVRAASFAAQRLFEGRLAEVERDGRELRRQLLEAKEAGEAADKQASASFARVESLMKENYESAQQVLLLKEEIERHKASIKSLEENSNELKEQLELAKKAREEATDNFEAQKYENEVLVEEADNRQKELEKLREENRDLEKEIDDAKTNMKKTSEELEDWRQVAVKLGKDIGTLTTSYQSNKQSQAEILKAIRAEKEEFENRNNLLTEQIEMAKAEVYYTESLLGAFTELSKQDQNGTLSVQAGLDAAKFEVKQFFEKHEREVCAGEKIASEAFQQSAEFKKSASEASDKLYLEISSFYLELLLNACEKQKMEEQLREQSKLMGTVSLGLFKAKIEKQKLEEANSWLERQIETERSQQLKLTEDLNFATEETNELRSLLSEKSEIEGIITNSLNLCKQKKTTLKKFVKELNAQKLELLGAGFYYEVQTELLCDLLQSSQEELTELRSLFERSLTSECEAKAKSADVWDELSKITVQLKHREDEKRVLQQKENDLNVQIHNLKGILELMIEKEKRAKNKLFLLQNKLADFDNSTISDIKIDALNSRINLMRAIPVEFENLKAEKFELIAESKLLSEELLCVQIEFSASQNKTALLLSENKLLKEKAASFEEEIKQIALDSKKSEEANQIVVSLLEAQLKTLDAQLKDSLENANKLESEDIKNKEDHCEQINFLNLEINDLKQLNEKMRVQLENQISELKEKEKLAELLEKEKKRAADYDSEISGLNRTIEDQANRLSFLSQHFDQIGQDFEQTRTHFFKQADEISQLQRELREAEENTQSLKKAISALSGENEGLSVSVKSLTEQHSATITELYKKDALCSALSEERETLKANLTKSEALTKELERNKLALQTDLDNAKGRVVALSKEIEDSKNSVDGLGAQLRTANEQLASAKEKAQKSELQVQDLQTQNKELRHSVSALKQEVVGVEGRYMLALKTSEEVSGELSFKNEEVQKQTAKIAALDRAISAERQKTKELEEQKKQFEGLLSSEKGLHAKMQTELAQLKDKEKTQRARISELEHACAQLEKSAKEDKEQWKSFSDEKSQLKAVLAERDQELKRLSTESQALKTQTSENFAKQSKELNGLKIQISELNAQKQSLEGSKDAIKVQLAEKEKELQTLSVSLQDKDKACAKLSAEAQLIAAENQSLRASLESASALNDQTDSSLIKAKEKRQLLKSRLQEQDQSLAERSKNLDALKLEKAQTAAQLEGARKESEDAKARLEAVQRESEGLKEELKALRADKDEQTRHLQDVHFENRALASKNREREQSQNFIRVDVERLETEAKMLKAFSEQRDKEIDQLKAAIERLNEEKLGLSKQLVEKAKDLEASGSQVSQLRAEGDRSKQKLEKNISDLQELNLQHESLLKQKEEIEGQLKLKENKINELEEFKEVRQKQEAEFKGAVDELRQKFELSSKNLEDRSKELGQAQQRIKELSSQVESLEERISEEKTVCVELVKRNSELIDQINHFKGEAKSSVAEQEKVRSLVHRQRAVSKQGQRRAGGQIEDQTPGRR